MEFVDSVVTAAVIVALFFAIPSAFLYHLGMVVVLLPLVAGALSWKAACFVATDVYKAKPGACHAD